MKFELMKPYFVLTSEQLKNQYNITMFPTVLLFSNGQLKQRWDMVYDLNEYRRGMDAVLSGPQTATKQPFGGNLWRIP